MTGRVPPSLAPITVAIIAAIAEETGYPCGDLGSPPGVAADSLYTFVTKADSSWRGSLANPHEMAFAVYQVQCVAPHTAEQPGTPSVEWLEHRVRQALATAPTVTGWKVLNYLPPDGPGGIRLDRDTTPHRAYSTPQWRLWAQPVPQEDP